MKTGKIVPFIDRHYILSEVFAANAILDLRPKAIDNRQANLATANASIQEIERSTNSLTLGYPQGAPLQVNCG
jgi:hypothetical protein